MKLTISEIAKIVGVSRGTVDRVIHNRGKVSAEIKEKVEKVIQENNYQPNPLGSALARKKSYVIGVILIEEFNPFFHIIRSGVEDGIKQYRDYHVEIILKHLSSFDSQAYVSALEELECQVDAFALIGYNTKEIIHKVNKLCELGKPVMTMNTDMEKTKRVGYIGINDYSAGQCLASLVKDIASENDSVLLISGHQDVISQNERIRGFLEVMKERKDIQISDVVYTKDDALKVSDETKKSFKKTKYQIVVSVSSCTYKIYDALQELHISKKPYILGIDLTGENKKYLLEGKIDYILGQSAYQQGYQTIVCLCKYFINHEELPIGKNHLPIHIYNKYNV